MRKPIPEPTPESQAFWEGTRNGELWIQRCGECGLHFFYPRSSCPGCGSISVAWVRASGQATLYSYVISHVAPAGFEDDLPFVIAVVELAEGPRMMTNLVDVEPTPDQLHLDMPLEVTFRPRGDQSLPIFRPIQKAEVT
jgi:hypothetical protein